MSDLYNSILVNSILKNFQDGNKKIAFKKLEKYIKKYPKDNTAVYNFAHMAQLLGHTDLAIINYKKSSYSLNSASKSSSSDSLLL